MKNSFRVHHNGFGQEQFVTPPPVTGPQALREEVSEALATVGARLDGEDDKYSYEY